MRKNRDRVHEDNSTSSLHIINARSYVWARARARVTKRKPVCEIRAYVHRNKQRLLTCRPMIT